MFKYRLAQDPSVELKPREISVDKAVLWTLVLIGIIRVVIWHLGIESR